MPTLILTSEWERTLTTVTRCVECPDSPCMRACPQAVNIRDALRFLMQSHPLAARLQELTGINRSDPDCGKGCE